MAYVGPVIALIAGVLGFLFSKSGERQQLRGVGYVLLAFLVISGGVSVLGVYRADQAKVAADRQRAEADRQARQAKAAAIAAEAAAARERSVAETFRALLVARTFAPDDLPGEGLVLIDLPRSAVETQTGSDPRGVLWPMLGRGIRAARLSMDVEDAVALDYRMRPAGAGATIDAAWTDDGRGACRLTSDDGRQFTAAPGASCVRAGGYRLNAAFEETVAGGDSFEIDLPRRPFWMTYSRIDQEQRIGDTIGQLVIEAADAASLRAILADAARIAVSIKFFHAAPARSGADGCGTSLVLHLKSTVRTTGPATATIDIGGVTSSDINFCEINLAD